MALCVNFITWKSRLSGTGSQEILGISLDFTYLPQTKLQIARCKRSSFFKCFEFNGAYTKSLKSIFDNNKLSASCFRNLKLVKFFSFFNTASLPYVDATVSLTCLCHDKCSSKLIPNKQTSFSLLRTSSPIFVFKFISCKLCLFDNFSDENRITFVLTAFRARPFKFYGAKRFNELPLDVKKVGSVNDFKSLFDKHIETNF